MDAQSYTANSDFASSIYSSKPSSANNGLANASTSQTQSTSSSGPGSSATYPTSQQPLYSLPYPQYPSSQDQTNTTPLGVARASTVGPNRHSLNHRREMSVGNTANATNNLGSSQTVNKNHPANGPSTATSSSIASTSRASSGGSGPYARIAEPLPIQSAALGAPATHSVKASSTTSEFTKRKNWSQHIIDEIQDFMHVLNPSGSFMFATPSIRDLCGWAPEELINRPISDYLHPDDVEAYRRDFNQAIEEGNDLTLYCRFRTKDDRYVLFEMTGHHYYADSKGAQTPKCFFAMGRPYPSKNQAMLDSFLELKFENERLRQELQVMYRDIEGGPPAGLGDRSAGYNVYGSESAGSRGNNTVIDPTTGLVQAGGLIPSSSNTYGALGIGISANGTKGDGTSGEKKKKKPRVEEGEFVCRDCGTVDSPEWRKGPEGPKSLCNACGLRYAKLTSKANKQNKAQAEKTK